ARGVLQPNDPHIILFGHTRFGARDGRHVIESESTVRALERANDFTDFVEAYSATRTIYSAEFSGRPLPRGAVGAGGLGVLDQPRIKGMPPQRGRVAHDEQVTFGAGDGHVDAPQIFEKAERAVGVAA